MKIKLLFSFLVMVLLLSNTIIAKPVTDWCLTKSNLIYGNDGDLVGENQVYHACGSGGTGITLQKVTLFFEP
jgi:hypothetical protein